MKLRTLVRDSLYLTWAFPTAGLVPPPDPLRYERHRVDGEDHTFVSAVISHQEKLKVPGLPLVKLSYCQLNLFTYVLDGDRQPAALVNHVLMPLWLAPGARLLTGYPVSAADFDCPKPSRDPDAGEWRWQVSGDGELALTAERTAPHIGPGPSFTSWDVTVETLRERSTVFARGPGGGLRSLRLEVEPKPVWPLSVDLQDVSLLTELLPTENGDWPPLYTAWLDAEVPMVLDLGYETEAEEDEDVVLPRVPAPG